MPAMQDYSEQEQAAPMPGAWTVREEAGDDVVPGWREDLIPEEEPDGQFKPDPEYQFCYKVSLVPFFEELNTKTDPSRRRRIIFDKDQFLRYLKISLLKHFKHLALYVRPYIRNHQTIYCKN